MNYMPPVVQTDGGPAGADEAIERLQQRGGYAVAFGDLTPRWPEAIAGGTTMTVVAALDSQASVDALRKKWYAEQRYGIRLTAQLKAELPAAFANLVVVSAEQ